MKPTELRIGNLVMYNGKVVRVEQITKHKIGYHTKPYEMGMNYARLCEIEPIPITEELLKKNGFEIDQNITEYELLSCYERRITAYEVKYGWHFHIDDEEYCTCFSNTLKYIHDLQNAFYLVTGKDLEIKI